MTFDKAMAHLLQGGKVYLSNWKYSYLEIVDKFICIVKDENYKYPARITHAMLLSPNWECLDDTIETPRQYKKKNAKESYTSAYLGDDYT